MSPLKFLEKIYIKDNGQIIDFDGSRHGSYPTLNLTICQSNDYHCMATINGLTTKTVVIVQVWLLAELCTLQ